MIGKDQTPDIGKDTQFQPGVSGNPAGRKAKLITEIIRDFKEQGYTIPSKADTYDTMVFLSVLSKDEIKDIAQDDGQPILVRIVARKLLSNKAEDMIKEILDRQHGKATQAITNPDGSLTPTIIIESVYGNKPNFRPNNTDAETPPVAESSSTESS